jgi:hypothetical protein
MAYSHFSLAESYVPNNSIFSTHTKPNWRRRMSLIDEVLVANRNYAKMPDPKLRERPTPKLAVVTCMDPRLSDLPAILGLSHADLDVIRMAGPAVTEDVLGELVASNRINRVEDVCFRLEAPKARSIACGCCNANSTLPRDFLAVLTSAISIAVFFMLPCKTRRCGGTACYRADDDQREQRPHQIEVHFRSARRPAEGFRRSYRP